jgi:hypothetical protein
MERPLRSVAFLSASLIVGCASITHGPDRPPTPVEIVGVYDWGHRGSSETWELRSDGTFTRILHPHFSYESPVEFAGTWSLAGDQLLLSEAPRQNGSAKDISATAFFYKRKPAFARNPDIRSEKVHEWWVYRRSATD